MQIAKPQQAAKSLSHYLLSTCKSSSSAFLVVVLFWSHLINFYSVVYLRFLVFLSLHIRTFLIFLFLASHSDWPSYPIPINN